MRNFYSRVAQLLDRGQDFVIAYLVKASGSTPREAGAKLIVQPDGQTEFTVGGGALEERVREDGLIILKSGGTLVKEYRLEDLGMYCGGRVKMLYEVVGKTGEERRFYHKAGELLEQGQRFVIAHQVSAAGSPLPESLKLLIPESGKAGLLREGWPAELLSLISEDGRALLSSGRESLLKEYDLQRQAQVELFLELVQPAARLLIYGGGHVGARLARLAAAVGLFRVEVVDEEDASLNELKPLVDKVYKVNAGYHEDLPMPDERTFVAIITSSHLTDKHILRRILDSGKFPAYLGLIGSARKRAELFRMLQDEGIAPEQLERVHMPIGLPIGGKEPGEIAVSVLAEVIQLKNAREDW